MSTLRRGRAEPNVRTASGRGEKTGQAESRSLFCFPFKGYSEDTIGSVLYQKVELRVQTAHVALRLPYSLRAHLGLLIVTPTGPHYLRPDH